MLDIILLIMGSLLLVVGLIGSVLPALPGPPFAYAGLLIMKFHSFYGPQLSWNLLLWLGLFVLLITVLDLYLPIWGTKKFGGSEWGKWGSTIGLLFGFFIPVFGPLSFLFGPFIGAVAGELLAGNSWNMATRSGWGSFVGFLGGTIAKLILCLTLIFFFIKLLL